MTGADSKTARYTALDRFRVQMRLAEMALRTAQRMLKSEEHQALLERWIDMMAMLRSETRPAQLGTKWR